MIAYEQNLQPKITQALIKVNTFGVKANPQTESNHFQEGDQYLKYSVTCSC